MASIICNLELCYSEGVSKFIPLLQNLRKPDFRVKLDEIDSIFSNALLWQEKRTKNGHKKFTHSLTGVIVEFQAHIRGKDNVISPNIQAQLRDQIQMHMNILCNEIFAYTTKNWKKPPDYKKAEKNYTLWSLNKINAT